MRICAIHDCSNPVRARGWCNRHWQRWKKYGDPLAGGAHRVRSQNLADRILGHISITATGCWEYTAARDRSGYGRVRWQGSTFFAHRLAYQLWVGPPPEAVCHACDNPPCVNPAHLFGGTQQDNVRDMVQKGRARHAVKLSDEHVLAIRQDRRLLREIAAEYRVTESTVSRIRRGVRRAGVS